MVALGEGRHFVLDGPPGTGKSQIIANIIAHNLALGRRVLFVAEKRAALEVVQRRLADKGLAPFCLELHSAKATKSAVLKQLDHAWTTRDALSEEQWAQEANEAQRLRDETNAIVALLHRREPNGWTIHRAIGRTVRDATETTPKFVFPARAQHNAADMARFRDVARRLGLAAEAVVDLPTRTRRRLAYRLVEWMAGGDRRFGGGDPPACSMRWSKPRPHCWRRVDCLC